MHRLLGASVLGLGCFLQVGIAAAEDFAFTTIRHPAVSTDARGTEVFGINDSGKIVGHFHRDGTSHPFLYERGDFTDLVLPFPEASGGTAEEINNAGNIVGTFNEGGTSVHAFVRRGDEYKRIRLPDVGSVIASGINNRGDILGYVVRPNRARETFVLQGGKPAFLKLPAGAKRSSPDRAFLIPDGINDHGHIVCTLASTVNGQSRFTGYLVVEGKFTEIAYPNAKSTHPTGINAQGHVVGYFADGTSPRVRGFLFRNGSYIPLDYPDARHTRLWGVNGKGQLVGTFDDENARQRAGFVAVPR